CRQSSRKRHSVSATLLLPNSPQWLLCLQRQIATQELGPFNSAFDLQYSRSSVQTHDAIEAAHIKQCRSLGELLAPRRVAAPGDGERLILAVALVNDHLDFDDCRCPTHAVHPRRVQAGMNVVH